MKKKLITILIVILVIAAAVAAMIYAYRQSSDYTAEKFESNYYINGVDCSGLTYEEAADKLTREWNQKTLTFKDKDGNVLEKFTGFACEYDLDKNLASLKENNFLLSVVNHYIHMKVDLDMKMPVASCGENFRQRLLGAGFLKQPDTAVQSQNAYVDTSDPEFPIIKEVYGNKVDTDKFLAKTLKHIANNKMQITYKEKNYYTAPTIKSDNKGLLKYQKFCQEKLTQKITYDMGESTYTIGTEYLANMYMTDGSGNLNTGGIEDFVEDFAEKYDNVGIKRTVKTYAGKTVTVSGGTYGWIVDQKAEVKQLKKDLEAGKDVERKPEYSRTGYTEYSNGIGTTYIDVDFTKQEVHLYIKGKDKFHCKVVTGDKSEGKATPEGTWFVKNKLRNVTMRGTNADGTKYKVPALYWMGVTPNGIGLHDSNWRTEFGGDIWKTNGSHGCINLPKWRAGDLYKQVEVGMPVIMHY